MLFRVLTGREETNSAAIAAANHASSRGTGPSPTRIWAASIDRLTFAGLIIETGSDSYRLAPAKTHRGTPEREGPRALTDPDLAAHELCDPDHGAVVVACQRS